MRKVSGQSLHKRLLVRLWVPLTLVLMLGAIGAFAAARYIGGFVHDRWLYDSAMTLAQQIKPGAGKAALNLSNSAMEMFEWDTIDHVFEQVRSRKNGPFFGNADIPLPLASLSLGQPYFYNAAIAGRPTRIVAVAIQNPVEKDDVLTFQVAETTLKRQALVAEILFVMVPLQLFILTCAGLATWLAVKSSLRVLDEIAVNLSQHDPDTLVSAAKIDNAPDEIRPLLEAINQLIANLAEAQETQSRFIANATHQLRTPLATLQVQTERALREVDPLLHREALKHVKVALERLRHLTRQLLTLARSERSAATALKMSEVDLVQLARDEMEEWVDAADARRIDLGLDAPPNTVLLSAEPHLLRELIGNLVDNAIKYGLAGGAVTVGITRTPMSLHVDNDGETIPAEERALVLERFYRRADTDGEGCGLGLAIAQEIARRHHATLVITETSCRPGTRVTILFDTE